MASSSARTPKDLKQMVTNSHEDMSDMQQNLAKLKALSADDKSENALLRSRIDEQSQLIMILKQRVDETGNTARTLERVNKELEAFREDAQQQIANEIKKSNMLDARFNELASNHEELIKIKDDYKRRNVDLMAENARLRDDNAKLFSQEIEDRDNKIKDLTTHMSDMERNISELRTHCATVNKQNKELQENMRQADDKHKQSLKALQKRLEESEEKCKGAQAKLLQQAESQQSLDDETQARLQQLTKEKDEMLSLAMQRGKLIQEKQSENKRLQQKITEMEKAVRDMELKFEHEAAAVNANLQVKKLRAELEEADERCDEVFKQFEAFKKHSSALLQKERDLNAKLRHLAG